MLDASNPCSKLAQFLADLPGVDAKVCLLCQAHSICIHSTFSSPCVIHVILVLNMAMVVLQCNHLTVASGQLVSTALCSFAMQQQQLFWLCIIQAPQHLIDSPDVEMVTDRWNAAG